MGSPQSTSWIEHIDRVTAEFAPAFENAQVWEQSQPLCHEMDPTHGDDDAATKDKGTTRLKHQLRQRFPHAPTDAIPMWIADMDTHPLPCIAESCSRFLRREYGYHEIGIGQSVSKWYQSHGVTVAPDSVVGVASVISGVDLALSLLTQPGDTVMLLSPTYGPLGERICGQQLNLVELSVFDMDEDWLSNPEQLKALLEPDAKVLVVCHPNNPTGAILPTYIQKIIAEFCDTHGITIISDEVHSEFGFFDDGNGQSVAPFAYGCPEIADTDECPELGGQRKGGCLKNGIHFNSVSKAFNLAAIPGASYAIISNAALRERFSNEVSARHLTPSPVSVIALKEAYQYGVFWLKKVRRALQVNRQYTLAILRKLPSNVPFTMGDAGYFLWLDLRAHFPVNPFQSACERGVIGVDGGNFNAPGFLRLNLACHPSVIGAALKRLFAEEA